MLTAEELDRLEAVAREATPGPWITDSALKPLMVYSTGLMWDVYDEGVPAGQTPSFVCNCGESSETQRHIAACDPQTILALVEMARRMQVAETELDGLRERSADHIAELTAERDELRKRAEVAEEDATLFRWLLKQSGSLTIWDASMEGFKLKLHGEFYGSSMVNLAAGINEAMAKESAAIAAAKKEQGNG